MSDKQPIGDIIKSALESVRELASSSTVIGEPINVLEGTVIIPVSRVSLGIASGGAEYMSKKEAAKEPNFGGGGGTGLSVSPVAFLVVTSDGNVRLLNIDPSSGYPTGSVAGAVATVDEIIDKAPIMISKIKELFKKKDKNESEDEE